MKHTLLLFTLLISLSGLAQESFSNQSGKLMEFEVHEHIENLGGIRIETATAREVVSGKEKNVVAFSKKYRVTNNTFHIYTLLEMDEVDALIEALPVMLKRVEGKSPDNYKEVFFRSRNGLYLSCYKYNRSWVVLLKADEDNMESYAYMHRHDLELLLDFLKQAKEKM